MSNVVVIGASVAGLAAAKAAAEGGAEVLLLERRSSAHEDVPPATVAFDALWPPPHELVLAEINRYDRVRVHAGTSSAIVRTGSRLYDRGRLDALLADQASQRGASIVWGARDILIDQDRTVRWRGGVAHPKVLILADGPDGWARKFVRNLDAPEEMRFGQAWLLEAAMEDQDAVDIVFTPRLAGGRLQLNPRNGATVVWAFQYDAAPSRRAVLDLHPLMEGRTKDDLVPLGPPRPDPVLALPGQIAAEGLLVAGGAAGQGGLELGFHAGTAAGQAAAAAAREKRFDAKFLRETYETPWKQRWMGGLERFRGAYNRFTSMGPEEQSKILGPWEKDGLDLHDVVIPIRQPGVRRTFAAIKMGLRNARRMRALLHTYRQLKE